MSIPRPFGALVVTACLISTLFLAFTTINSPVDEPILTSRSTAYYSGVERTWNAAANGLASNPARWDPVGVPATGDNITFDGTSVFNCNWDVVVTLGNFSMLTGYTGTVTQTVAFGCVDFTIELGTFTGSTTLVLTLEGNLTKTGGIIGGPPRLTMNGDSTFGSNTNELLYNLTIDNDNTVTFEGTVRTYSIYNLNIGLNCEATLESTVTLRWYDTGQEFTFSNLGVISGAGTFAHHISYTKTVSYGIISVHTDFIMRDWASASRIITLGDNANFASITLVSNHLTYTFTLHHGGNYTITATGVVMIETRSIMTQGTGAWSFGSYAQTGVDSVFN